MSAGNFTQGARWTGDMGPTWNDCYTMADHIWAKRGRRVEIKLVQPVRRLNGTGNSGWAFVVSASPRQGCGGETLYATARYGQGGSWKTAPQALHAALRELEATLEGAEVTAAKQAAF